MTTLHKTLFDNFEESVQSLSSKLPQWNSTNFNRKAIASVSSLLEELGEISGLISKYCTREKKEIDFYNISIAGLPNNVFDEVRNKFIDETSDFLWVLFSSAINLLPADIYETKTKLEFVDLGLLDPANAIQETYSNILEKKSLIDSLYAITEAVIDYKSCLDYILINPQRSAKLYENLAIHITDIINAFANFFMILGNLYHITLDDVYIANMEKLGIRYNEDGQRVDGK